MSDEHSRIRAVKQKWDDKDAARDEQERRAKAVFLEEEANRTFAPIEDYLMRLAKVLSAAGASLEIDATWEHLGDQRLRRVAKLTSTKSAQKLALDLTIQGVSIFYREKPYRFSGGIAALIAAITTDVEQFLTPGRSQASGS
jgi:hypothetical protein